MCTCYPLNWRMHSLTATVIVNLIVVVCLLGCTMFFFLCVELCWYCMLVCEGCKCRTNCEGEGQSWVNWSCVVWLRSAGDRVLGLAMHTSQDELRCVFARLSNEWGSPCVNCRECQVYHMFARLFHAAEVGMIVLLLGAYCFRF